MGKNTLLRTNIFICIIIIVGFAITSIVSYRSNRGIFKKDVENIATLTSEGIYYDIDAIFTKPINISSTMANDSLLKNFLLKEENKENNEAFVETMRNYLNAYKEKYSYDSVFLVSSKTNCYYHFNKGIDRVLTKEDEENDWYYDFLASSQEYSLNIDNDEVKEANNEITIFINYKIKDSSGNIMGVVGVGFRVNSIQKIFQKYEEEFDVNAFLVNEAGMIEISTNQTGYEKANLFAHKKYSDLEKEFINRKENELQPYWYSFQGENGYLKTQYIPNLEWYLIIDYNTYNIEQMLNFQLGLGILTILIVIVIVLVVITKIVKKYNCQIIKYTLEEEKEHRSIFQLETEKLYENIYELNITHNCAASEETETYFESLGVPRKTPYDEALLLIAKKQIKEKYREGYIRTFCRDNVLSMFEKGIDRLRYDFMITNDQGKTYYWMRITACIFYWDSDKSVRMFVYRQNIDEEKCQEKHLLDKMEKDSLTGLYNKISTQEHIKNVLRKNKSYYFAFFILDIDNFKNVNDTFGHAVGDMVIIDFAQRLKKQFPSEDIVGRIGGDEFAVFLSVPSKEWVEQKVEDLSKVLHYDFVNDSKKCIISSSIGVSIAPEAGNSFDTLYKKADKALYRTKKAGKDGYTIYKEKER